MGKKKKSRVRVRRIQNRILSVVVGICAAAILLLCGYYAMDYGFNSLIKDYVKVPNLVGQDITVVQAQYAADKNFEFEVTYEYDNTMPYGTILSQTPEKDKRYGTEEKVTIKVVVSNGSKTTSVPGIVGLPLSDAKIRLTQSSLTYELDYREDKSKPENTVLSCTPEPGTVVDVKTVVKLVISTRSVENTVTVPPVVGKTNTEAMAILTDAGLQVSLKQSYSNVYPAGYVMSQSPSEKNKVAPGSTITLIISRGPIPVDPTPTPSDGTPSDGQGPVDSDGQGPVQSDGQPPLDSDAIGSGGNS